MDLESHLKRIAQLEPPGLGPRGRGGFDANARKALEGQGDAVSRTTVREIRRHEKLLADIRTLPPARHPEDRRRVADLIDRSIAEMQTRIKGTALERIDALHKSTKDAADDWKDAREGTGEAISRTRLHREELSTRTAGMDNDALSRLAYDMASGDLDVDAVEIHLAELMHRGLREEAGRLRQAAQAADYSRPWRKEANAQAEAELNGFSLDTAGIVHVGLNQAGVERRVVQRIPLADLIAPAEDRPLDTRLDDLAQAELAAAQAVKAAEGATE